MSHCSCDVASQGKGGLPRFFDAPGPDMVAGEQASARYGVDRHFHAGVWAIVSLDAIAQMYNPGSATGRQATVAWFRL